MRVCSNDKETIMQLWLKPAPVCCSPLPEVLHVRRRTGNPLHPRVERHFRRPSADPPLVLRFPGWPAIECPASRSLLVTWFFENVQVSAVCKLKKNKYTVHTAVDSVSGDEERNDFALLARVLVNNLLIRFNSQTHTNNQPVWIRYVGLVQKHTFVIHVYHLSKIFCFAIKTDTNLLLRPHRPYVSGCTYQRVWRLRTLHLLTENDQMLHSILYSYKGITLNWWKGKHSLHEKTAASVLLKLFISGNEWCHTTDAPSAWAELHFQM